MARKVVPTATPATKAAKPGQSGQSKKAPKRKLSTPAAPSLKPDLIIHTADLTATARDLVPIIARAGRFFDRGSPVKVITKADGEPPEVKALTVESVLIEAHTLARPVTRSSGGQLVPEALPDRVSKFYLALDDWDLPPLRGITTAPLLAADGSIRSVDGYDRVSRLWCANLPSVQVSERPTIEDARAALLRIRQEFQTFPFSDSVMIDVAGNPVPVVDLSEPPGMDESAFVVGLMTAVCRASLPLAPGLLIAAPHISGAGSGKGLLIRAVSLVAYGIPPAPFTGGESLAELEKRIGSALMGARPALFIDNVNGVTLKSNLLASILTEPNPEVRLLGFSRMMRLNSAAFIAVTGNGISLGEDLARRFVVVELDPKTEDPEARPFDPGFVARVAARRIELLNKVLTIWRWGRQNEEKLPRGRPLGSYEEWCRWVRDPLLALGAMDPVERIRMMKARDPERRAIGEFFAEWFRYHESRPVTAHELEQSVVDLINPQRRSRQFVASEIGRMVGARIGGLVLTQQRGGKWGAATYALLPADCKARPEGDAEPMPPMVPMVPTDLDG